MVDIPENPKEERPITQLLNELTQGTVDLFRKEIELARAEVSEKVSQAGSGATEVAVGGLVLFVGLQALAAAAIIGLSYVLEWWLAALVVGLVILVVGGILVSRGISNLRANNLMPKRTIESMKENTHWAREQTR